MKAVIALQDTEAGEIAMNVIFEHGFNIESNAHQHAHLLIKVMDILAAKVSAGEVTNINMDDLEPIVLDAMDTLEREQFTKDDPVPNDIQIPQIEVVRA